MLSIIIDNQLCLTVQDGYIASYNYRSIASKTINLINGLRVFNAHVHSAILTSRPTLSVYEAVFVVFKLLGSIITSVITLCAFLLPKCTTGSSFVFGKVLYILYREVCKISIILH